MNSVGAANTWNTIRLQRADNLDQADQGTGQPSRLATSRMSPGRR